MSADGAMTPTRGSLFAALAKAQAKIKHAVKDSKNPHFNSRYADLAAVAEACREALTENGICVIQDPYTDGPQVVCVTTLGHASGEQFESRPLRMAPQDLKPQTVGSCVTYLRRYQLAAIVGVAPDDDDGNAAQGLPPKGDRGSVAPAAPAQPKANTIEHTGEFASHEKVQEMLKLRSRVGGNMAACIPTQECKPPALCAWHKMLGGYKRQGQPIRDLDKMSPKQIDHLIDRAHGYIAKQAARAAETPDIGAIIPDAKDIRAQLATATDSDASFKDIEAEICSLFGCDKITDIEDKGDKLKALSLVTAYAMGPEAYEKAMAKAREAQS